MSNQNSADHDFEQIAKQAVTLEWGTEQQINAENAFTAVVESSVSLEDWHGYETFCLKATTQEIINEGLRLLGSDKVFHGYES